MKENWCAKFVSFYLVFLRKDRSNSFFIFVSRLYDLSQIENELNTVAKLISRNFIELGVFKTVADNICDKFLLKVYRIKYLIIYWIYFIKYI